MSAHAVDTRRYQFLITLADSSRRHHAVGWRYFDECAHRGVIMYLSAIVIAEFSVRQSIEDLGLRHFIALSFTSAHAIEAGRIYNYIQRDGQDGRVAVKDDIKLISQCLGSGIDAVLTEDRNTLDKYLARAREQNC